MDGTHLAVHGSRVVPVGIDGKVLNQCVYVMSDITTEALLGLESHQCSFDAGKKTLTFSGSGTKVLLQKGDDVETINSVDTESPTSAAGGQVSLPYEYFHEGYARHNLTTSSLNPSSVPNRRTADLVTKQPRVSQVTINAFCNCGISKLWKTSSCSSITRMMRAPVIIPSW